MRKPLLYLIVFFLTITTLSAQQPKKPNASEVYESIKKLNFLGSVLYVAAHPDDENTRLISYMSNNIKARTAYLSLTRGDGGQNLIGPEIRELLGVIRTQELLAARRIDGGEQRFTRANDFGYSKHPDETLAIWNKEEVLSDVVLAIRQFKPDIIINRFDHRSPGSTHGHHTSSAMLSVEAFDIANDASKYTNQLQNNSSSVWQPKRLFFNTSWWFYGSREKFEKADKSRLLNVDIGVYYPSSGLSNTEIASLSRSQHKSQGFGNTGTRGSQLEYIELIKGDMPSDKTNIFDGIDTTWNRIKGGQAIGDILYQVEKNYDFTNPSASVPALLKAFELIKNLEDLHWKRIKSKEIKYLIKDCLGLYFEVVAQTNQTTNTGNYTAKAEVVNRSNIPMKLIEIDFTNNPASHIIPGKLLEENVKFEATEDVKIISNPDYTTPYWLKEKGSLGMYKVEEMRLIGDPDTQKPKAKFAFKIYDTFLNFYEDVVYKTNDPVKGEVYKPFEIIPEASVKLPEKVIIFENDQQREIPVIIKAGRDNLEGYATLCAPKDWNVYPEKQKFTIKTKGQEETLIFTVIPPKNQSEGLVSPIAYVGENDYTKELIEIEYDHIPFQTVLLPSESKVVRLDIKKRGENIGYIVGAGDVVPESLRQIGYSVVTIEPEDITPENLNRFDAVVVGIRAYNTVEDLNFKQQTLFDYVARGGNMIVQYNTRHRVKVDELAPYSLKLSRDRVTDENAKVTFLKPDHELLNFPNKITEKDFEGWTQERGLYFPNEWSSEFTALLSMNDKGESAKKGSLLVAKHGKGHYIYTGLSFFREFPAGVSGAYRLFANMLSIGKDNINSENTIKN